MPPGRTRRQSPQGSQGMRVSWSIPGQDPEVWDAPSLSLPACPPPPRRARTTLRCVAPGAACGTAAGCRGTGHAGVQPAAGVGGAGRSAHLPNSLCLRRPASSSAGKEAQSAGGSRPPTAAALLRTPPLGPGPEPSSEPRSRGADSPRATPGGRGAGGVRPGPRAPAALCLCLRTRVQNLPPDTQETWLSPVQ